MSDPQGSLRDQASTALVTQYKAYRKKGVEGPLHLNAVLWTLDDVIADAAESDYVSPDQPRLRDLETLRASGPAS